MKNSVKLLVIFSIIILCVCDSIHGSLRSRETDAARSLSVNKVNSGQMLVNVDEDLLSKSQSEDISKNPGHDLGTQESKLENPSTEPTPILNVQPMVSISTRIYDILSGVGVLLTMLMYQIASYYWHSFTSNFRFLRSTENEEEPDEMNVARLVTDAITNLSQQFKP